MLIKVDRASRPPIPGTGLEDLRRDVAIAGKLETADQFIHKAVRVAQESLSRSDGQIDDSVKANMLLRNGAIQLVAFKFVECMVFSPDRGAGWGEALRRSRRFRKPG